MKELNRSLPSLQRMALSYAPARSQAAFTILFSLDARLAGLVRSSSEPMLAQLRLAWWRETLSQPAGNWPTGDPLLAAFQTWPGDLMPLVALCEAWEVMTADPPLAATQMLELAKARGGALAELAITTGHPTHAGRAAVMGTAWGLSDIAANLSRADERETAQALLHTIDWRGGVLPRALRPLSVLHGLAVRAARRKEPLLALDRSYMLPTLRLGLFGR